jgi:hypothetical protein
MDQKKRRASAEMLLRDMLYLSYLVPGRRIRDLVPGCLPLAVVGGDKVFVSLVIFRGITRSALSLPAPPIPFDQVNIRTYVTDPVTGKPAVYFLRCGISGRLITFLYGITSGMPVEHAPFTIWPGCNTGVRYLDYRVQGFWTGEFSISAQETSPVLENLHPFADTAEALAYLIDPLAGFYMARGILRRLEIYHAPLLPRVCEAVGVHFPLLTELGILDPEEIAHPHSTLLVPSTPFSIYLPPKAFIPISIPIPVPDTGGCLQQL